MRDKSYLWNAEMIEQQFVCFFLKEKVVDLLLSVYLV